MEEQSRYAESLEFRLGRLKAAFQGLAQTAISSDFLKNFVDGGTAFVNVLTQIVKEVGVLTPLLAGLGGFKLFKNFA